MEKEDKIKVIYLIGMGHSGSTLMDLIMDCHSQVVGVGELCAYHTSLRRIERNRFCSCGQRLNKCSFWRGIFRGLPDFNLSLSQTKKDFLLKKEKYIYFIGGKKYQTDLAEYIRLSEELYQRILSQTGKKVIFESSKCPYRAETLLKSKKIEMILVHLVRDGRGVAYSYFKSNRSPKYAIKQWGMANIKTEIVKRRNPVRNIFVKYTDFAKAPQKVLTCILSSTGLRFELPMMNFREKTHHQAGGNKKLRLWEKSQEIKEDIEWRSKLPFFYKFLFNVSFGWLNLFYKFKKTDC